MTRTHEGYAIDENQLVDFVARLVGERSPSGEEGGVTKLVATEMEQLVATLPLPSN